MAFLRLTRAGRYNEDLTVNTEEISEFYEDRHLTYSDYILVMKNGIKYCINYDSYRKLLSL